MTSTYFKFYILFSLFTLVNITSLFSQDVIMTPKSFIFSWQKASGDKYEIPVKNNLEVEIEQQKINRVLMQILLKSSIKSKDFEFFNPSEFTLIQDEKNMIVKFVFTELDTSGETEKSDLLKAKKESLQQEIMDQKKRIEAER